jgi:hypothetical protein
MANTILVQKLQSVLTAIQSDTPITFYINEVATSLSSINFSRDWDGSGKLSDHQLAIKIGVDDAVFEFVNMTQLLEILLEYAKVNDIPDLSNILNDIETLQFDLNSAKSNFLLKEEVANKSNEISDSSQLYPSNKSVYDSLKILDTAIQNVAKDIPYIQQGQGDSTKDVISQAGFTSEINRKRQCRWGVTN